MVANAVLDRKVPLWPKVVWLDDQWLKNISWGPEKQPEGRLGSQL